MLRLPHRALARSLPILFALAVTACAPRKDIVPEPEPVHVEPPPPEPDPPPKPARWSVSLEELGWDEVPDEPPRHAFRANTEGLRSHERGDWAASSASFAEAVRDFPDYDLARYNLACAYARLGRLDQSLEALTQVLERDFPRFLRRALEDGDLQRLRRSGLGEELEWRIERIEEAWRRGLRAGVAAVAWRKLTRSHIAKAQDNQGQLLRPGVWIDETQRFLTMMELYEGVHTTFVDPVHRQAVVLTAERTEDVPPLFDDPRLYVVPLDHIGDTPYETRLEWDDLRTIELHATRSGVRFRLNRYKTAWQVLDAAGVTRDQQGSPSRPVMFVTPDGSVLTDPMPEGWSVKNRTVTMPDGRTVRIQSIHSISNLRSVQLSADGRQAVVVGVRAKCGKDGSDLRHAVDWIDVEGRRANALAHGDGAAAAMFGPDGALYVQSDRETRRYEDPRSDRHITLPDGVLLAPPMRWPTCKK